MTFRHSLQTWLLRDPLRYQGVHADLVSSRSGLTLEQYLWKSVRIAVLSGLLFALIGYVVSEFFIREVASGRGIYNVFNLQLPAPLGFLTGTLFVVSASVLLSFAVGSYLVYLLLLRLPGIEKNNRSIKINLTLHNAVAYMYAMRRGGAELMAIFYALSENAPIYGEVALEFRQVTRDVDYFGSDVITAVRHLSQTTPSAKLKDFLEDLLSVIGSGGNLSEFFAGRVRLYQEEARFEQKQFLTMLSMVAESYVTLFVAGPLFLIIIMVVMGMMGGPAVLQLSLVIYAIMPIGSLIFILLIDLVSGKAEKAERYVRAKELNTYADVQLIQKTGEESLFHQLRMYDKVRTLTHYIRHPFESFVNDVNHTLYVTIPVAILYLALVIWNIPYYADPELFIDVINAHIVIALLIVLVPYAIFYEIWSRKVRGIQAMIPDFLERMAGINRVGLTIAQAIAIMVNTNLGLLSYEIRRIKRDMDWGVNFSEALMRFEQRISTASIARTVTLITKASEMSGQIGEVLEIAASDAKMSETLKRERLAEMFIYTAIVYLSFFVFLFVVAVLATQFLPVLAHIGTSGISGAGPLSGLGSVPVKAFNRLLYHACLIQALFSGLIAGQMGEASLAAGVKHSCILLAIALITFSFIIVI
ncbi:type II secretion system F family protein [Methanoregula sp.]|uniref:type II secretion system F family protein n=1 Tax=Methanoregula sp. TaxID=2052170 RepID=UPI002CF263D9|nr:type II secretion system F family protein [Methanoregula sp.]HVP95635.1 type II secretion system F family protein [Methanoregula sp.]